MRGKSYSSAANGDGLRLGPCLTPPRASPSFMCTVIVKEDLSDRLQQTRRLFVPDFSVELKRKVCHSDKVMEARGVPSRGAVRL